LGASLRIDHQIARIKRDVGNNHRLTQRRGGADDSFAGGNPKLSLDTLAMLNIKTMTEDLLLFVIEHDAEDVVVDNALDLLGGAAKQLLNIENRAHFAAELIEQ